MNEILHAYQRSTLEEAFSTATDAHRGDSVIIDLHQHLGNVRLRQCRTKGSVGPFLSEEIDERESVRGIYYQESACQ